MSVAVYAVYHRTCGHVVGGVNSRELAKRTLDTLGIPTRHFRIRVATDDDLMALLRGDRCQTCTLDGQVTT